MNRIIITVLLVFTVINTYSQSLLGFKGSFNISSMSSGDAKSRFGFDVGAMYSTYIAESWSFQPSLTLSLNGVKAADKYTPDYSAYFYSLESPLLLSHRMGNEDVSFGVDMGVFVRYGLFGGYWTDSPEGRIRPDIFDYQKRFDVGPQVGFSVIAQGIYMGCGVQYGLIKPWKEKRGNYYNYFMSFGYLFEVY